MALTDEDKQWIEQILKKSETNLRKEIQYNSDKITEVESSLREEIKNNRRSRSAKLRVVEKI